ncbi:hypothetical protein [Mitsuokella jalaludinii]|uniref:hypothetical protein n=1 Tax=Mitsuokella jalaludinii TaxID=187979 RepID=UPI003A91189A
MPRRETPKPLSFLGPAASAAGPFDALPSLGVGARRGQLVCPPKRTDARPVSRLPAGWLVACGESGGSGAAAA